MSRAKLPPEQAKALARDLRKARALLAKRGGWIKGRMENNRGGYCTIGACYAIACSGTLTDVLAERDRMLTALHTVTRAKYVYDWNDSPRRTKAQVLAAFTRAAKRAERGLL